MARPSDTTSAQSPRSGLKIAASCIAVCLALTTALLLVVSNSNLGHARIPDNGREPGTAEARRQLAPTIPAATTVGIRLSVGMQGAAKNDAPDFADISSNKTATSVRAVSVADRAHPSNPTGQESKTTEQSAEALVFLESDPDGTPHSADDDQSFCPEDMAVASASHGTGNVSSDSTAAANTGAMLFLADSNGPAALAEAESSSESEPWQWRPLDDSRPEVQQSAAANDVLPNDGPGVSDDSVATAVNDAQPASELRSDVAARQNIMNSAAEKKVEPFVVPESADRRIRFFAGRADRENDSTRATGTIRNQNLTGDDEQRFPAATSHRQTSLTADSGSKSLHFVSGERDTRPALPMPESRNNRQDNSEDQAIRADQQTSQSAPQIVIHNHISGPAATTIPQEPALPDPRIAQLQRQVEELALSVQQVTDPESRKKETAVGLEQQQRTTDAVDANTAALREMQVFLAELRISLQESQMSASATSRRLAAEVSEFTAAINELQKHVAAPRFAERPDNQLPDHSQSAYAATAVDQADHGRPQSRSARPPVATFAGAPLIRPRSSGPVSTRSFSGNAAESGIRMEPLPGFEPAYAPNEQPSTSQNQSRVDEETRGVSLYPPVDRTSSVRAPTTPMPADPAPPKVDWPSPATVPVPLPKTLEIEAPVESPERRNIPAPSAPGTSTLRVPSEHAVQEPQIPLPYPPGPVSNDSQPAATTAPSASPLKQAQPATDSTSAMETPNGTGILPGAIHAYVFDPPPAAQPALPRMTSSPATLKTEPPVRPVATTAVTSVSQRPAVTADEYTAHPTSGRVMLSNTPSVPPRSLPDLQVPGSDRQKQTTIQAMRSNPQPGFLTRTRARFGEVTDSITDMGPVWTDGITRRPGEWEWPRRVADGVSDFGEDTAERLGRTRSKSAASERSKTVHRTGAFFRQAFQPNSVTR